MSEFDVIAKLVSDLEAASYSNGYAEARSRKLNSPEILRTDKERIDARSALFAAIRALYAKAYPEQQE